MSRHPTIPEHLRRVARSHPDGLALIDGFGTTTFRELGIQVDRTAQELLGLGLSPGDRVGLALQPSVPYMVLILGAMAAGVVPALLNTRLSVVETQNFLEPLEVAAIITDQSHEQFAAPLQRRVIVMESTDAPASVRERMAPFHAAQSGDVPPVGADAPALILPTGGTSGAPKGVWFDHAALWRSVAAAATNLPRKSSDRELYSAPFFHIMLPAQLLYAPFMAGSAEILTEFDAGRALDAISRGATRLGGAPSVLTRLRQHPAFEATRRDRVTQVLFGAAPASSAFMKQLLDDYPSATVISLYGATEYGGPVCSIPHKDLVDGELEGVGVPWPGQHVQILDADDRACPPGETGYFSVRSMGQANGYWGRPEQSADVFRPSGVRVGDMGWQDDRGRFYIIGRDSEMIVTGGENVFPSEVEPVLSDYPAVREVLVFGVPDDEWGQRIEALVVCDAGRDVTLDELRAFGRDRLAAYKRPKVVHLVDSIPLTANNKPDRKAALRLAMDSRTSR